MNKAQMVEELAKRSGISKRKANEILGAVFEIFKDGLRRDGEVCVMGFGRFYLSDMSAKTIRNPRTGEPIKIPPTKIIRFKAGRKLKSAVKAS